MPGFDSLGLQMTRQFTEADELLLQLNALNVQVNDGKKAWRGDGLGFGQRGYERLNVEDGPNADVEKIEGLIVERGQAKKMRDYDVLPCHAVVVCLLAYAGAFVLLLMPHKYVVSRLLWPALLHRCVLVCNLCCYTPYKLSCVSESRCYP